MIAKILTYSALLFCGLTKNNFYTVRDNRHLKELVSVHHIIPRQFRNHPVIQMSNYEIENGYNLMFLPTNKARNKLILHKDRPFHSNGHNKYNKYVETILDDMFLEGQTNEYNLCKLNKILKQNMRHLNCPW